MRGFLLALLLLFGVVFVLTRASEVQDIAAILRRGDPRWILLAFIVTAVWVWNVGTKLKAIFRALGVNEKAVPLSLIALGVNVVSAVTPSAGVGGIGYFMARTRQRGHPLGRAASAAAMYLLFDYFAALGVVALALVVLLRRHQLAWGEVLAAVFLAGFAGVIAYLLLQAMRSAERFADALAGLTRIANRLLQPIFRRDRFDIDRARHFAEDFSAGLERARRTPGGLVAPVALALSNKALLLAVLFLVFMAFRQPASAGTVIAAFGIVSLFAVVSPTPGGLGFVEGAMTLVIAAAGIPLASATVITLAFRGITFWFPLLLGFFALRWAERSSARPGPA
jgi:uncharacterized protein (TIRG00374 family)